MTSPAVICLGEVLFDCLTDQPTTLPEFSRLTQFDPSLEWVAYPGGSPANVACALQKLGTPSAFVGSVGKDALGNELCDFLQAQGVTILGMQVHPTAPTRQVYVLRDHTGDRHFAGFSQPDPAAFADAHIQASQLPQPLFQNADYLVLGTLGLAYPETRAAITQALAWANQFYLKVMVDLNWRPLFWVESHQARPLIEALLAQVDVLKVSEEEAKWLFDTSAPEAIAAQLPDLEGVLVTRGAAGCQYCFHDQSGEIPGFNVPTIDTTGAGDSFFAGFIHQLRLRGIMCLQDPQVVKEMVRYASAVGALTTLEAGAIAAQPTSVAVEQFLATHA